MDILNSIKPNSYVVGCDEVGVGEYFTNLTVCCALFKESDLESQLLEQTKDSKALTALKLENLYNQLIEKIKFQVIVLEMEKYNYLIEQGFNSHVIKTILYLKILKQLKKEHFSTTPPQAIIIDGFVSLETFESYLLQIYQKLNIKHWNLKKYPLTLIKKADEKLKQASAASIIAKYSLTMTMQKREKKWKTIFPKGSSGIENIVNYSLAEIKKHSLDFLRKNAKYHFKTTQTIIQRIKNK
ncbi:ribonuclease HIII [Mesomycoplasma hyorhinis]|uniref:Ribonuclease n=3 Tax=Mesomycoplasma hyorhinis TaxID=2100 RepID=A0AAJ5NPD3_MESHY|nr:ribonuclease HIII [Mesomycoplasma hyorhinis]AEC46276.1 Ribonuclease HII [Mesomycoplasma hyorhinis MCLD]AEX14225.1 ribonuclease HIII [Mesomycoplasma hyorhinis GDL-1]AFX74418.1 Ribonuclease HIII [Mesomycoplasma hyorhinis SK76]AHA41229.1 ribonuclease HII family protein [Mesomycoplasma hyorhinis DBS 1050]AOD25464.1 ribonuclease HIII [Mesomycoplasma hyorhinis]